MYHYVQYVRISSPLSLFSVYSVFLCVLYINPIARVPTTLLFVSNVPYCTIGSRSIPIIKPMFSCGSIQPAASVTGRAYNLRGQIPNDKLSTPAHLSSVVYARAIILLRCPNQRKKIQKSYHGVDYRFLM